MKHLYHIAILFWCLAYMALAEPFAVSWDANPEPDIESYLLEIKRDGESITQVLLVSELREVTEGGKPRLEVPAPIDLQPGDVVTVAASNGFFTGEASDPFKLGERPGKAGGLRVTITITVESPTDTP